ncbi:hypothetical protein LY76DRAFT_682150 [Colletotrichum caudatum]|nr:hypothetical protein LY76DRAFT_682150 [Colletotrichum caudatum]
MASMYRTNPTFENYWTECLGDLAAYRMYIEADDPELRNEWKSGSRQWYLKASDKAPTTGRLYHHLAILARPNALQQLFYYAKSLCVPIPFLSSRESMMKFFDQHLNGTRMQEIHVAFVRVHAVLFTGKSSDLFAPSVSEFINNLNGHIAIIKSTGPDSDDTKRWRENSYYIAIALGCAMLEYGSESNVLMRAIKSSRTEEAEAAKKKAKEDADWQMVDPIPNQKFLDALDFAVRTHNVVFRRSADSNVDPYLHVTLSFLYQMSHFATAIGYIESKMPWKLISSMLNSFLKERTSVDRIELEDFPRSNDESPRPLPEDFAQRGLLWVDKYYPDDWFTSKPDDDEKYFEVASMTEERQERCLWLGCRIASSGNWLTYDKSTRQFGVAPQYDLEIPGNSNGSKA